MRDFEQEVHADAREATARQVFKQLCKQDRSDISVAIILQALDDWYEKGFIHGKREQQ